MRAVCFWSAVWTTKTMRVFLIGFMGAGKSYWGARLATLLRVAFFDTDQVIAQQLGLSIADIFRLRGEEYFRRQETLLLQEKLSRQRQFICATGGGMPVYKDNLAIMQNLGITVFLDCSPEVLWSRIRHSIHGRPLLARENLQSWIAAELQTRYPYYQQADYILQADRLRIQQFIPIIQQGKT